MIITGERVERNDIKQDDIDTSSFLNTQEIQGRTQDIQNLLYVLELSNNAAPPYTISATTDADFVLTGVFLSLYNLTAGQTIKMNINGKEFVYLYSDVNRSFYDFYMPNIKIKKGSIISITTGIQRTVCRFIGYLA